MERIKNWARKIRDRHPKLQKGGIVSKEFAQKIKPNQDNIIPLEDRFRNFLTNEKAIEDTLRVTKTIDKILTKNKSISTKGETTVVKQIIDKSLRNININFEIKLEAQFEKDYPGRKAIWKGKPTGLFKKWLQEHNLFDNYFNKASE